MISESTSPNVYIATKKTGTYSLHQQQRRWGWFFLAPWLIGFVLFSFFPMLASLIFSFTDYKIGANSFNWVGLHNWTLLFSDTTTVNALMTTLRFSLVAVPLAIFFPMVLAVLMTSKWVAGKPILRVLFYAPYMVPAISGVFVWQAFLNGQTGWMNHFLRWLGTTNPPNWLYDSHTVNISLTLIMLWGVGNAMLTMMIGLQNIPTELYEAGAIDGASKFKLFQYVTLPLFSPMIFYNLILSVIAMMQYFVVPWVISLMTYSNQDLNFINVNLYRTAFRFSEMGYASAQAWLVFIIAMIFTVLLFWSSRNWVYYLGRDDIQ